MASVCPMARKRGKLGTPVFQISEHTLGAGATLELPMPGAQQNFWKPERFLSLCPIPI